MSSRTIPVLFFFALTAACGGKADVLPDGGDIDSGPSDGGGGPDGNGGDASPGPDCPTEAPAEGAACSKEGIQCEYGGDPRWVCNTIATCTQNQWTRIKGDIDSCPTPPVNPPTCPGTYGEAQKGGACTSTGTICDYSTSSATQFCSCNYMGGPIMLDGGGATWLCGSAYDPACPTVRPRAGSSCATPDTYCTYDVCGLPSGLSMQCDGLTGTWVTSPGDVCASAQN
ncbi:MAG TPA: hypothetical protein VGH28_13670 [Polyangiaceae bacterium]|jgi:hypothetical protein